MICPKCNHEIEDGSIFCRKCGTSLVNKPTTETTQSFGNYQSVTPPQQFYTKPTQAPGEGMGAWFLTFFLALFGAAIAFNHYDGGAGSTLMAKLFGYALLVAALVLSFIWDAKNPSKAKYAKRGALIGLALGLGIHIVNNLNTIATAFSILSNY